MEEKIEEEITLEDNLETIEVDEEVEIEEIDGGDTDETCNENI